MHLEVNEDAHNNDAVVDNDEDEDANENNYDNDSDNGSVSSDISLASTVQLDETFFQDFLEDSTTDYYKENWLFNITFCK